MIYNFCFILRQLKCLLGKKYVDLINIVTDLRFKLFCKIFNYSLFSGENSRLVLPKSISYTFSYS